MFFPTPSCAILQMIIEAWPFPLYNDAYSLKVQKSLLVRNNWDADGAYNYVIPPEYKLVKQLHHSWKSCSTLVWKQKWN